MGRDGALLTDLARGATTPPQLCGSKALTARHQMVLNIAQAVSRCSDWAGHKGL